MKCLIIGGAGFIGVNFASRLASMNEDVFVADNLSRRGADLNLAWLQETYPGVQFVPCDICATADLERLFRDHGPFDLVAHLAAQVAVTTSVKDPVTDFEINARGALNVLETIRRSGSDPIVLFASTNKVYGGMENVAIEEAETRYRYADMPKGVSEEFPLDFHSPYGCSKGCADQYMRDYARIYGLRTVIFRQSAIYGPRQFGVEDQGWVAWFTIAACKSKPITIYGDGKQVRDLLWVEDLIDAYLKAVERIDSAKGEIFNIGGGPDNTISVWKEFGPLLEKTLGEKVPIQFADWRPGDQKVCVMNIDKAKSQLGWSPKTPVEDGVAQIAQWVRSNQDIL